MDRRWVISQVFGNPDYRYYLNESEEHVGYKVWTLEKHTAIRFDKVGLDTWIHDYATITQMENVRFEEIDR